MDAKLKMSKLTSAWKNNGFVLPGLMAFTYLGALFSEKQNT